MKTEDQVDALVDELVERLGEMSEDSYFREAIMKTAIRRICHGFVRLDVYPDEIAEHLDVMADVMRDETRRVLDAVEPEDIGDGEG